MNIAWGTAAILALLLPGFFFLRGLGLAEPFARDATPRSPVATLALAVLVSILAHAFGTLIVLAFGHWVRVDLQAVILLASGQITTGDHLELAAAAVGPYTWWIAAYFLFTSVAGYAAAFALGRLAIATPVLGRLLFEHEWLHTLNQSPGGTLVYALTNLECGQGLLIYQGRLRRFGIRQDGRFAFVVLESASRGVLLESSLGAKRKNPEFKPIMNLAAAREVLYLDGEAIANLVFDLAPLPPQAGKDAAYRSAIYDHVKDVIEQRNKSAELEAD